MHLFTFNVQQREHIQLRPAIANPDYNGHLDKTNKIFAPFHFPTYVV